MALTAGTRPGHYDVTRSADGRLVFGQRPGDIGVLTAEGDRTVEMLLETGFAEEVPALSPDGRWIAYQSSESGEFGIYVTPVPNIDDGKWQVSTNISFDPVWSPDGRSLFFKRTGQMMVAVVETDPTFSPGTPTGAFSIATYAGDGAALRGYDLAPDGERFLWRKGGMQTAGDHVFTA